ncbi:MAG: 3-phosphoshikimate 1-carboxyvinyltransferase, partial [Candidatus Ranarchaeia archaeon]
TPDLVPAIAALGAFANGQTIIKNSQHLRLKETNRIENLSLQFQNVGVDIEPTEDGLIINGPTVPQGTADALDDHRIAMSLAVLGLRSPEGIVIQGAECVSKSYPKFYSELEKLGGGLHWGGLPE